MRWTCQSCKTPKVEVDRFGLCAKCAAKLSGKPKTEREEFAERLKREAIICTRGQR